jgi:DNA invertase Pin-like site-specific DNA recombinase
MLHKMHRRRGFRALIMGQFDTSTALGRLFLNLLAALAEFELELIYAPERLLFRYGELLIYW